MFISLIKGELEHRIVKLRYARTNRRRFVSQLVKMSTLETIHEHINEELEELWAGSVCEASSTEESGDGEADVKSDVEQPYKIAVDQSNAIWLRSWLQEDRQRTDPAFSVCIVSILVVFKLTISTAGLRATS